MLVATRDTVYALNGDPTSPRNVLADGEVQAIAEGRSIGLAALEGGDVAVLSQNGGRTLATGIEEPIECLLIMDEDPLHFLVGVEAPHVYAVTEDGTRRLDSFDALECRGDWYTPWGGPAAVRSMARTGDGWVYADIHVGSIMRSPDRGRSWDPVTPDLHQDVHQVATSPREDNRVYANTAHAVFVSGDRGASWQHRSHGFPYYYGRAIAVHPEEPDCLLASVSTGPHGDAQGQLYRTDNAGRDWSHVTDGFPDTTAGNIDTFHIGFTPDGRAWSVADDTLYGSRDRGRTWAPQWKAPSNIRMIAVQQ
ncbi:MAG: hypothetical protein OXR72_14515 [Gemmatimonadota bacterium]|nr:hypothetical protein [Gemmatimonadota bacterium]